MSDYFYMSESYWDAIQLKPKQDIYFLGFAIMNHYEKKPFSLIFKYVVSNEESSEYEVAMT